MRHTMSWIAGLAVTAAILGSAPAMACGGGFGSPCGSYGYASSYGGYNGFNGYGGYGHYSVAPYERLADPTPVTRQYFYANQGPTFSGPGVFAPVPTYQETAIGWRGYPRYDGGPYANPLDHYSYGRRVYGGPLIQSYRWRHGHGYRHGNRARFGYAAHRGVAHAGTRAVRPYNPPVVYGSDRSYQRR